MAACAVAAVLFVPAFGECPAPAAPTARSQPAVRIEHQLVRIYVTAPGNPAPRPVRLSAPQVTVRGPQRAARIGLLARATRAFTGDGRYRPEPFPRATR
jgi:hypothetical protein